MELEVGASKDSAYRRYEFGKMFVVDYKENYVGAKEGNQEGSFQLNLTQRDDNWDSVDTFPQ